MSIPEERDSAPRALAASQLLRKEEKAENPGKPRSQVSYGWHPLTSSAKQHPHASKVVLLPQLLQPPPLELPKTQYLGA